MPSEIQNDLQLKKSIKEAKEILSINENILNLDKIISEKQKNLENIDNNKKDFDDLNVEIKKLEEKKDNLLLSVDELEKKYRNSTIYNGNKIKKIFNYKQIRVRSNGLYLRVQSNGKTIWCIDYRYNKKRQTYTVGSYPKISLKEAKNCAEEIKVIIKDGKNPSTEKKKNKENNIKQDKIDRKTFRDVAEEWFEKVIDTSKANDKTKEASKNRIIKYAFPQIGSSLYKTLTPQDMDNIILHIYKKHKTDLILKVARMLEKIGKWARRAKYSEYNICDGVLEYAKRMKITNDHHPYIEKQEDIRDYFNRIKNYNNGNQSQLTLGLEIIAYIPVRVRELCGAIVDEFDFDKKIWCIPANRMKTKIEHYVPLPEKISKMLKENIDSNGGSKYVFPTSKGHITKDGFYHRFRAMGYKKGDLTTHGFRSTFATLLGNTGLFNSEYIQMQLSHIVGNQTARAYDHSKALRERRILMESYCYILDEIRNGKDLNDIVKELEQIKIPEFRGKFKIEII